YPTIIGETGVPINLYSKQSYQTGDYTNQTKALDCSLNAADGSNVLSWTLWNYTPDNTHEWGDGWNLEDFSIWSADDAKRNSPIVTSPTCDIPANQLYEFITSGTRGVGAFARPWPIATVGTPIHLEFDIEKARFEMRVRVTPEDQCEREEGKEELGTEVYIPLVHYATESVFRGDSNNGRSGSKGDSPSPLSDDVLSPSRFDFNPSTKSSIQILSSIGTLAKPEMYALEVDVSEGRWSMDGQVLMWWYDVPKEGSKEVTLKVRRKGGPIEGVMRGFGSNRTGNAKGGICVIA
ncbi:hypothetical protein FRC12_024176, partial [Ceratobasidium sp. 428]